MLVMAGQWEVPSDPKASRRSPTPPPSLELQPPPVEAALRSPSGQIPAATPPRPPRRLAGFLPTAVGPAQHEPHLPLLGFQISVCQLRPFIPSASTARVPGGVGAPGWLSVFGKSWVTRAVSDPPAALHQMANPRLLL